MTIGNYHVAQIDASRNTVILTSANGNILKLTLPQEKIDRLPVADFLQGNFDWSKSTPRLPNDIAGNWSRLSADEKNAYIRFYLQHGWILTVSAVSPGVTIASYESLAEQQREQEQLQKIDSFKALLSPDQLAQYNELAIPSATGGSPGAAGREETRADRLRAFLNQLTPQQLEAYNNLYGNKTPSPPAMKLKPY